MICPKCGNLNALYLDVKGNCRKCPPSARRAPRVKKPKPVKKPRKVKRTVPIKATGLVYGTVRHFASVLEASEKLGIEVAAIHRILRGDTSGKYAGWKLEREEG